MKLLKHLKRDLIDDETTIALIDMGDKDYKKQSALDHKHSKVIADAIQEVTKDSAQSYKVIIQALFEGGFLSTNDSDFSCDQLLKYVYGVKVYHAIDDFIKLFDMLMKNGMTDHTDYDKKYNPSGDNYYSAYEFDVKPTDIELRILDGEPSRTDVKRKVIVVENQSPMFAYILDYSMFINTPDEFTIVLMKGDYDDPDTLPELLHYEFDLHDKHEWDALCNKTIKIITTMYFRTMECNLVTNPTRIEYALFNIYSGHDAMMQDLENLDNS